MRVLVTNDDGIESPGLRALAHAIQVAGHDVFVVAPSGERSGSGAAIGRLHRGGPIACREVEWSDLPGAGVHAVDMPPAAAVYAGCAGAFGPAPDVVASGVNPGLNYGHLVIHSGTIGAALTARVLGVSGVAASIGFGDEEHWATAATPAAAAVEWAGSLDAPTVVNINAPNLPLVDVRGIRAARIGPFNERWSATTRRGELLLEYEGHTHEPEPDTDIALVHDGYIAVSIVTGVAAETTSAAAAAAAIAASLRAGGRASPDAA